MLASGGTQSKTWPVSSDEDYKFQASVLLMLTSFYQNFLLFLGGEEAEAERMSSGRKGEGEGRYKLCVPLPLDFSLSFPLNLP